MSRDQSASLFSFVFPACGYQILKILEQDTKNICRLYEHREETDGGHLTSMLAIEPQLGRACHGWKAKLRAVSHEHKAIAHSAGESAFSYTGHG
ncbi:hypothetical protein M747DRAFT_136511 [Aspergillus niger ATCC 13496]|uniref:Uncharacterized protein n=1 Tax=Aspergillus niger ATCC 13496 TaxID=1353008 RepID=A0A370CE01_ASPNG|nr:hypothetical protein M747DRAFT_136511 [Aspergillus niger ATCC 13496]